MVYPFIEENLQGGYSAIPDLTPPHKDKTTGVHGAGTGTIATSNNVVLLSAYTAKGMILAASAANAPTGLTIAGTTGYILTADSSQVTGIKWAANTSGSGTMNHLSDDTTPTLGGNLAIGVNSLSRISGSAVYFQLTASTATGVLLTSDQRIVLSAGSTVSLISAQSIAITAGATYNINLSTSGGGKAYYNGVEIGAASGMTAIVQDTNPQLGGNLDTNGYLIHRTSGSAVWGQYSADSSGVLITSDNKVVLSSGTGSVGLISGNNIAITATNAVNVTSGSGSNINLNTSGGGSVLINNMQTTINDVSASRAANTSYQNTTGAPLEVVIVGAFNNAGDAITMFADSATAPIIKVASAYWANTTLAFFSLNKIIPCNWYYRFAVTGTPTVANFWETQLGT